jgi:hypothetical protein
MSPEQARGDEDLDQRTDLYSAGVVLYEMLTGRTPFQAHTPSTVIHHILHDEPPHPRTINEAADPHLASLSQRLLAKRPEDRFASAAEAIKALEAGARVQSLEKRRRARRRWLLGLAVLVLVSGTTWLLSRFSGRPPIAQVWVQKDQDGEHTTTILARYGDDPTPAVFHEFPLEARGVSDVVRADLDGKGRLAVVASISKPLSSGDSLFAFDAEGHPTWSMDLSSSRQWPDCGPTTQWMSGTLATADVDDEPGDEIIVVAHDDYEYPTRVSIIDPRTEEIKATFWHFGHISSIRVVPDFFGAGRPAIIAHGKNNKLDGFYEPRPGDPDSLTDWDIVSAVMILDPREMLRQGDGLGPPRTDHVDIPLATPYAYAFLDGPQPHEGAGVLRREHQTIAPRLREPAQVSSVGDAPYRPDDGTGPWFSVKVQQPEGGPIVTFIVDRNLALGHVVFARVMTTTDDAYWRNYWRPIIQNGEYVRE